MSLTEKLLRIKAGAKDRIPADALAIMLQATEDLVNSNILDHVVKVGDKAPDFSLPNPAGEMVDLRSNLEHGPVVLTYYRGKW